jgi:hypothetical protein
MKKPILLIILLLSLPVFAQQKKEPDVFRLKFKLLNKNIKPYQFFQPGSPPFWAEVRLTNINGEMYRTGRYLPFGWKGHLKPFYLEATNLDGKEEDISFDGSYSDADSPEKIELSKGKSITDTLNIPVLYSFKRTGTYKVRVVFNTIQAYNHRTSGNYGLVYSNWDTVYVKE